MEENTKETTTANTEQTATKPETQDNSAPGKSQEEELKELKAALAKANALISRANSEAADYKRQLRDKQTEAEKQAADLAEENRKRDDELAHYKELDRVNQYTRKLVSAGYDMETAAVMANGLPDGVSDSYFDSVKASNEKLKQTISASAIANQPGLSVGLPPTSADARKEELNKMRKAFGLPTIK